MTCAELGQSFELYVLGCLDDAESLAITEHLATGCETCQAELKRAIELNGTISQSVNLVEPPARLRRKLEGTFLAKPAPRRTVLPWAIAIAATLALAIGLTLANKARQSEAKIADARAEQLAKLSKLLEIVEAPGTKTVAFNDPKSQARHGSLFIHQGLGIALVVGSLPTAPGGWKYESWVVPKSGAPEAVEPFQPNGNGQAITIVPGPVEVNRLRAIAVSMEPENSRPVKPTTLVLSANL